MSQDLSLAFFGWFMTFLIQVSIFPLLNKYFKDKLVDRGWAFGRLIGWLLVSLPIWFVAHLGLPANSNLVVYALLALISVIGFTWYQRNWQDFEEFLEEKGSLLVFEEWLFLIFYTFLIFIRAHKPEIIDLEKFMDAGLMQAYLSSPTLPLQDMWLAGEKVNYYTFGHFLGSIMSRIWSLDIEYSYNLLLGVIMGLTATQSFSLAANIASPLFAKEKSTSARLMRMLKVGLLAVVLIVVGGNGHAVWYLFKNGSFQSYWYPDATRFIERTIHEFPSYSFIVSDLHAHVFGLPLVLLLLTNIWVWLQLIVKNATTKLKNIFQKEPLPYLTQAVILGAIYGLVICTSTWDFLVYSLLISVLSIVLLTQELKAFVHLVLSAVIIGGTALVFASPWLLNFVSISQGVRIAQEQSPLWQLVVLWLPHLSLSLIALFISNFLLKKVKNLKEKPSFLIIIAMVMTAAILLGLPELIYFKDIYPSHPRANTMFKLTFQAFILMGLVISWLLGTIQKKSKLSKPVKIVIKVLIAVFILSVSLYPYFGYRDYYNKLRAYQGLNGMSWMQQEMPADHQVIMWLRSHTQERPVIVEAVGESYTKHARISTFSGLPTVLGWRVHEWLWRGGFDIPAKRTEEVRKIYEQPGSKQAQEILDKYQVEYIVVGGLERKAYTNLDHQGIRSLGQVVFEPGNAYLVRVD